MFNLYFSTENQREQMNAGQALKQVRLNLNSAWIKLLSTLTLSDPNCEIAVTMVSAILTLIQLCNLQKVTNIMTQDASCCYSQVLGDGCYRPFSPIHVFVTRIFCGDKGVFGHLPHQPAQLLPY